MQLSFSQKKKREKGWGGRVFFFFDFHKIGGGRKERSEFCFVKRGDRCLFFFFNHTFYHLFFNNPKHPTPYFHATFEFLVFGAAILLFFFETGPCHVKKAF